MLSLLSVLLFTNCSDTGTPPVNKTYRFNGVMNVDEWRRTFVLQLPSGYYENDTARFPLVIGLHGTGGSASQFERSYNFSQKAESGQFIVAYPDGVPSDGLFGVRTWNAGKCCDYAMHHNVDDVKFISELISRVSADYKVDPKRVYVAGMSNGAMLAYRLACEIPQQIAAIATVSGTMQVQPPCQPSRPVPILHVHSAKDTKVPYLGGIGIGGYYFPPVDSVLQVWSSLDTCGGSRVLQDDGTYRLTEWYSCANGVIMRCYLTQDGGHAWPGGHKSASWADTPSTVINANDLIWDFFRQFTLP